MKKLITLNMFMFFVGVKALAELGAHGSSHESPVVPGVVLLQALNLGALLIILYFVFRKKAAATFQEKKATYLKQAGEVERLKQEAAKQASDIKNRLANLESSAEQSILKAKSESEVLRKKLVLEAKEQAARYMKELERSLEAESLSAAQTLREELVSSAIEEARKKTKMRIQQKDQERLQREFVEKIKVVES